MSDSENSSDWDGIEIDQTTNTSPLTLPQNPKVKNLDDMTSFLTSATIALPQMQQAQCKNDDDFDDFDDFDRADDIIIPSSVQIKSTNEVDSLHNLQRNSSIDMKGIKSGPTLITMDNMASLTAGNSATSLQNKHTRTASEVSEEDCFANINDEDDVVGFEDMADDKFQGSEGAGRDKLYAPEGENIQNAREVQCTDGDESTKLEQETESIPQKTERTSQVVSEVAAAAGTNSLLSAYASKEEDEDNWDNEFELAGTVTGQQLLRGPSSRPPSSPLLRQALTNSSNSGSNNAMAMVYRKQSSPVNAQGKTKMTLFTLPTNSASSVSKNGIGSHKIHLHTLPSPVSASGRQGGGMMYDAAQQKWVETGDTSPLEEIDWGSDDEDIENTSAKNTAPGAGSVAQKRENDGDHINGGAKARSTTARISPPPQDSQSHERSSSHADFEISADLKARLFASEVHHQYLFNSFLGPKEYAHYIDKISKSHLSSRPATAWAAKTSTRSKMASSAGVWPSNVNKTSRGGNPPSPNTSVRGRGSGKTSKPTEHGQSKQDTKFEVNQYKIPSATKIGSRKQQMLTEIWEEFSKR